MLNPYKQFSKVNPQRENGNRQIATSVLQHLVEARLSGPEYQVVLCIIDMTWGWGKREDMISLGQFTEATKLDRRQLCRVLDSLKSQYIIIVQHNDRGGRGRANIYMLNKHWDTWLLRSKKGVAGNHLLETVTHSHPLASNSDAQSPFINSDAQSPFSEIKGDYLVKKGDNSLVEKGDSQSPTKERKKVSKENIYIKKGEGKNVLLTDEETQKLILKFGPVGADGRIESLSLYKGSTGRKYASDYLTILNWERRNTKEGGGSSEGKPGVHPQKRGQSRVRSLTYIRSGDEQTDS